MLLHEKPEISVRLTASRANHVSRHVRRISDLRWSIGLCLLAAYATPTFAADQDSWKIRILPATKLALAPPPAAQPAPGPALYDPGTKPNAAPPMPPASASHSGQPQIFPGRPGVAGPPHFTYADVYRTIPFSRAEYVANPSYRSSTALGLMLNQMPYPSTGQPPVPQYGYVAPYQWDNTYGIPTFSNIFYPMPVAW
jgi:hypothetical protein